MDIPSENIKTLIWDETASQKDPFVANSCRAYGFDVYKDILANASWSEYLLLLFTGKKPERHKTEAFECLAIALANMGPREHSVRAAMNSGVGGSGSAAGLMAALAVGAGNYMGGREVVACMELVSQCQDDLGLWEEKLNSPPKVEQIDVWPEFEHIPGYNPDTQVCSQTIIDTLNHLYKLQNSEFFCWFGEHRKTLEGYASGATNWSMLAAVVFYVLGMSKEQAEILYMFLKLPGAAVHSLEQRDSGWRNFPFCGSELILTDDPNNK